MSIELVLPGSGYKVMIRRQPMQIISHLKIAASTAHEDTKPIIPTQRLEVEAGVYKDIENPADADYVEALQKWETKVNIYFGNTLQRVILDMGIISVEESAPSIDESAKMMRQYKDMGVPVPDDKRKFYFEYILAPTDEDVTLLTYEIFGKSLPKQRQVELYRIMFLSDVPQETN